MCIFSPKEGEPDRPTAWLDQQGFGFINKPRSCLSRYRPRDSMCFHSWDIARVCVCVLSCVCVCVYLSRGSGI